MIWQMSWRDDPFSRDIADRHYSRQTVGASGFVQPGRCLVLKAETKTGRAYWVTSWPFEAYVKHEWAGAWQCTAFRNEGAGKASEMIRDAVSATRIIFGDPPPLGMVTFVDRKKVKPYLSARGKEIYGQVYRQAGFHECGETKAGLLALQMLPEQMPEPLPFAGYQANIFGEFSK